MRDAIKLSLCVIAAFFLALRVIAQPVLFASPAPGVMALCAGGEIVYVALNGDVDEDPNEELQSDPCPFMGVKAVTSVVDLPRDASPQAFKRSEPRLTQIYIAKTRDRYVPGPRAPPRAV